MVSRIFSLTLYEIKTYFKSVANFRKKYCEKYNCPGNKFTEDVFWRAVYRPVLARLIKLFFRDFYRRDRVLIRDLGEFDDIIDFYRKTRNYYMDLEKKSSFFRQKLKLRVSIHRLENLYREVME